MLLVVPCPVAFKLLPEGAVAWMVECVNEDRLEDCVILCPVRVAFIEVKGEPETDVADRELREVV